ncbi:MAG: DMT family transporter [Pseudomonadota bacterium]|nr:DMT family transporter [Pseudomonadota bacterium]
MNFLVLLERLKALYLVLPILDDKIFEKITKLDLFQNKKILGIIAALLVVFIWSFWLIVSRIGVKTQLSIYDLAAIRFGLSSLFILPFIFYFRIWKTISLKKSLITAFSIGPFYALLAFGGFYYSPAYHGGVFMNGFLPAITVFIGFVLGRKLLKLELIGTTLILIGSLIILFDHPYEILKNSWKGDISFIFSAFFLSFFIILVDKWDLKFSQILYSICFINAIFYLPIWILFLPKSFDFFDTSLYDRDVLINIIFQGFVPNIFGLYLTAFAAKSIGTSKASSILAAVPISGAVLGFFILSEIPSKFSWISLFMVSIGILVVVTRKNNNS